MRTIETVRWEEETASIVLIDQTRLPLSCRVIRCRTPERLITAIRRLEIRGAPALGVAGAFGVAHAALTVRAKDFPGYLDKVDTAALAIGNARPTAVNLSWGVQRVMGQTQRLAGALHRRAGARSRTRG